MNEFDFGEGDWDGPHEDPMEADSVREAVAVERWETPDDAQTVVFGDLSKEEEIVTDMQPIPLGRVR